MSIKKIGIICLFVLIVGAAVSIFVNIYDAFVTKTDEIVIEDNNFKNIEVISDNASVEFIPTKDAKAKVEYSGMAKRKWKYNFSAKVKKDTLYIELTEKNWNLIQFGISSKDMRLTVHVPEMSYNEIKTEIDNGQIKAKNIQVKDINLETDNGIIDLKDIKADSVNIRTDNGKITMNNVEGKIDCSTDNGRILLITNNLERPVSLSTDNGMIEIKTNSEPKNVTIDAEVDLGILNIFGKSNKQTIFGNGENLIKLETDNGKITVGK